VDRKPPPARHRAGADARPLPPSRRVHAGRQRPPVSRPPTAPPTAPLSRLEQRKTGSSLRFGGDPGGGRPGESPGAGPFRAPRQPSRKLFASCQAPRLPVSIGSGAARHASSGSLGGWSAGGHPRACRGFGRLTRASAPLFGDDRRPGAGTICTSSGSHGNPDSPPDDEESQNPRLSRYPPVSRTLEPPLHRRKARISRRSSLVLK
jgi:hypothetical protein